MKLLSALCKWLWFGVPRACQVAYVIVLPQKKKLTLRILNKVNFWAKLMNDELANEDFYDMPLC